MSVRKERDTLGEMEVPAEKWWGAQTQRSRENFKIGTETMPQELIEAFLLLKKAAATANLKLGQLNNTKSEAITQTCNEIISEQKYEHFPLVVWQTGSGTQTNMNANEVIAFRGNERLREKGENESLHPNDDVNRSQSSNDTFPTAMHIAAYKAVHERLLPEIEAMISTLQEKEKSFENIIKIGRTHLQDATPLTLAQEVSGWRSMLEKSRKMIEESSKSLTELAIGGTAVGTGINAPKDFGSVVAHQLSVETGYPFVSASNKFQALTSHDHIVYVHGAVKALAADTMKMANDVRWLASGPRSGIGELAIPANEPGSSIMPGKVNPTQSEALTMVVSQVFGNDASIGFAASQGNFELNVYKPVIIYNFLQSITLLTDALKSFNDKCLKGLEANEEKISEHVEQSLMLVTALNPHIGYEKAAAIAKKAFAEGTTLKEAAMSSGYLSENEFNEIVQPDKMVSPSDPS